MSTPNLFHYATSELSQDAFICYLLAWANLEYEGKDKSLHHCAVAFIEAIFKMHPDISCPKISKVEIKQQYEKIDVFCIINEQYPIIIEDKTWTANHDNQLVRYYEKVKEDYKELKENILKVYYKTGDQGDYSDIKRKGYQLFLREDILKILKNYQGNNIIVQDYKAYVQALDDAVNSYKETDIRKWDGDQWTGFFLALQEHESMKGDKGNWGYVANPSGGFWGFWWNWHGNENDCLQYLQLEKEKLCFKIEVREKNADKRREDRDKWYNKIMEGSKTFGLKIKKPNWRLGQAMTVCVIDDEYLVNSEGGKNEGIIDIEKTVKRVINATKLLQAVAQ